MSLQVSFLVVTLYEWKRPSSEGPGQKLIHDFKRNILEDAAYAYRPHESQRLLDTAGFYVVCVVAARVLFSCFSEKRLC